MKYKKGDRVKHPGKPDWGLGQVMEDSSSISIKIFFVEAGERQLLLSHVTPVLVTGAEAIDSFLDNLSNISITKGVKHISFSQATGKFLHRFPQGFSDKQYISEEREYKEKAHELALTLLGQKQLESLLSAQSYGEICSRAMRVINKTNLVFPQEKMALKEMVWTPPSKFSFNAAGGHGG